MKKEIKDKWIKALINRSYRKGDTKWLHTKRNTAIKWSALGVLTDLWQKERGYNWNYIKDDRFDDDAERSIGLSSTKRNSVKNEAQGLLNPAVVKWAGLKDEYATFDSLVSLRADQRERILEQGSSIAALDEMSFKDLALIIEKSI